MGLFDSIKDVAAKASEKATQAVADISAKAEQKKAEQEAMNAEMTAKVEALRNQIVSDIENINTGNNGILSALSDKELTSFTQDFAEKCFLPANTTSKTHVIMYPYISQKNLKKIHETFEFDENSDMPILHIKTENKQEILFTKNKLFFKVVLPENKKFTANGVVDAKNVNDFEFVETENGYSFKCDTVELISFKLNKTYKQDFITLNDYFDRIKTKNFDITADDVDNLIKQKVCSEICKMFEKYYTDDNEKVIFFDWGVNSYTANDYVICTDNQVLILDREMGGATMNVKQLYYDDITSAQIIQNSNSGSLTADLINTAITAALDIADLTISAAGATIRINNLYKNEAERIVAIYHQMRKQLKNAAVQPQQPVQQNPADDPLEQLQKLSKLKDAGIISEEDFNAKKAELLAKL